MVMFRRKLPLLQSKRYISSLIYQKMKAAKIIPDVIDTAPDDIAEVVYKSNIRLGLGTRITPSDAMKPPTVKWNADSNAFYVLCMTEPDAPSRSKPRLREWQHWLILNIPGGDIDKGELSSEYVGAGPPRNTGWHRYVFLIYKQPTGRMEFHEPKLTNSGGWCIGDATASAAVIRKIMRKHLGTYVISALAPSTHPRYYHYQPNNNSNNNNSEPFLFSEETNTTPNVTF